LLTLVAVCDRKRDKMVYLEEAGYQSLQHGASDRLNCNSSPVKRDIIPISLMEKLRHRCSPPSWSRFPCSDRGQKRVGHRTCLWNDKLYLVGGFGPDGKTPCPEICVLEIPQ
ncbi:unnamed protein product, partial [Eretmochelys imbricata]